MLSPPPRPRAGDRIFIRCEGGPNTSRLVTMPPPLEIDERGGTYVLDDSATEAYNWFYVFVPASI